jgi:hypothetical protein
MTYTHSFNRVIGLRNSVELDMWLENSLTCEVNG